MIEYCLLFLSYNIHFVFTTVLLCHSRGPRPYGDVMTDKYVAIIKTIVIIKRSKQESPAVADKPAGRLRKVCTVYVRAVGL